MKSQELRTYVDKYGKKAVMEAACIKERLLYYMLKDERNITPSTARLIKISFPEQ